MAMDSLSRRHIFTKGLPLAATIFSLAATGVFASSAMLGQQYPSPLAFAQDELGITDTQTDTADTTTTTTTSTDNATGGTAATTAGDTTGTTDTTATATNTTGGGGGANRLAGIISSLQLAPDRLAPEWVTAGYWEIQSDIPLLGPGTEGTQPTVNSFDAIIEMARLADGSFLHQHTISNFRQSEVLHSDANSTTVSGTATVVTEQGPTEDVPIFITLQNNLISIAIDPVATENHFGPTPISGLILTPEHLQQISELLTRTLQEGGVGAGTGSEMTTGSDTSSMTTGTIENATGQ
ncbi:MAG: hypothetical protein M3115_01930 [Thermoproteota archaeon]|nr:hypothetical protein [Thermoproteota archaeon]